MPTILRLSSIAGGCNCHKSNKRHETCNPQQRIVPIRTQGSQQSRRPHVHGRQWRHSHQQWSGTQHIANNKGIDVIGCRGKIWRTVHQCQNGSLHATHSQRNGTSTNLHPHTNRQFNCPHTTDKQNYSQGVEGHGLEIPLVALPYAQDQYHFYWRHGTQNLADYWTEHHPVSHHKAFWPQILTSSKNMANKSFVKKIISTQAFVEQMAAQQQTIAAKVA